MNTTATPIRTASDHGPQIERGQVWKRDGLRRVVVLVDRDDNAHHRPSDRRQYVRWTRPGWNRRKDAATWGTRVWLDEFEGWAEGAELVGEVSEAELQDGRTG